MLLMVMLMLKLPFHHLKLSLHHLAMPFGELIFGQIIKIVATRGQILFLRLKCAKFYFGWGSVPDPAAWGAYSAVPVPQTYTSCKLDLRGLYL